MSYTEKMNNLVIDWIEVTEKKKYHIKRQEYEYASRTRDNQRIIERKINEIIGEEYNSNGFNDYIKKYLADKHGIDWDKINLDNIKETIREIKLNQLGI
jgi:hypothetical protein